MQKFEHFGAKIKNRPKSSLRTFLHGALHIILVKFSYYLVSGLLSFFYKCYCVIIKKPWTFRCDFDNFSYVTTNQMWDENPDRCSVEVKSNFGFAVLNLLFFKSLKFLLCLQWKKTDKLIMKILQGYSKLFSWKKPIAVSWPTIWLYCFSCSFVLHLIGSYTIGNLCQNQIKVFTAFWIALKSVAKNKTVPFPPKIY